LIGNVGNKHKTLVDQFAYPNNGTGTIYELAAKFIQENGGQVYLNEPVKKVIQDVQGKVIGIELLNGAIHYADAVVSTMPLTILMEGLVNTPIEILDASRKLYFRNTILVYLEIDALNLFDDNWIYVHSPEVKHGRITNFRNWSKDLYGDKKTTIICLEFWAFDQDLIWGESDQYLAELAKKEINLLKLLPSNAKIINEFVMRVPRCYPVYETGYQEHLIKVENHLNTIQQLYPIGRYGSFKYNNQDHSILMGLLAAEKIINGIDIDLWQINTDIEYQEEGKIKDVLI
jgi:protoporphyrinogen oxidase